MERITLSIKTCCWSSAEGHQSLQPAVSWSLNLVMNFSDPRYDSVHVLWRRMHINSIILIMHRQNLFTSSYHRPCKKTEMLRVVAKNSTEAKHPPIYNSIRHDLCLPAVTHAKPRSVWLRDIDLMAEQRNSGDTVRRVPCLLAVEVCTSSDWRLPHCTEI